MTHCTARRRRLCEDRLVKRQLVITMLLSALVATTEASQRLLGEFQDGWRDGWSERMLSTRRNAFGVVEEGDGNRALQIKSDSSASALWYDLKNSHSVGRRLSWRWRIDTKIDAEGVHARDERTRSGDDFRARVLVVFDRDRALCYVWASSEAVGSVFPSPADERVTTFVLRTGDGHVGQWLMEERDIERDYKSVWGESPEMLSALALMVDTDDTDSQATTRFDDVVLTPIENDHEH